MERFLYLMFAMPTEPYEPDPVAVRALEALLILHLDHEQCASASTVRTAGSSQANPFACVAAGIASLWGPAHGGANEAVLHMLEEIGTPDRIGAAIARAKDKADPFRLQGFGHRVYKTYVCVEGWAGVVWGPSLPFSPCLHHASSAPTSFSLSL